MDQHHTISTIQRETQEFLDSDKLITLIHEDSQFGNNETVIVLDSSFNPPNRAHLHLIRDALRRHPWNVSVLFLLSTNNADKGEIDFEDVAHRVQMMQVFWRDVRDELKELAQDVPLAYGLIKCGKFIDKLKPIQTEFHGKLCFLTGFDTILRVLDKKYYNNQPVGEIKELREFMDQCEFQSLTRQPDQLSKTPENMMGDLDDQVKWVEDIKEGKNPDIPKEYGQKIFLVKSTAETKGVHSTAGRELMKNQDYDRVTNILTPQVIRYILQAHLYS